MAPSLNNLVWFYRGKEEQFLRASEPVEHQIIHFILAALTLTGFLAVSLQIYSFLRLLLSLFVIPGKPLRSFGHPSESWALITGASDGIGKEFALQLARAGYSTLLTSRTQVKLDDVATEIKQKYNTPTKTLAIDFSANIDIDYARLKALVDSLDIAILINNVGVSHSIPVTFAETPKDEMDSIITVNCIATLRVTQVIVPGMIQRKRGLILTMGSFGGLIPSPLLATYSGSKAFLQQWSTALGSELAFSGVTVELVQSHLVTSKLSKIRKPSTFIPNPKSFVKSVLGSVGRTGGAQGWKYTSTPYWSHAGLQWFFGRFIGPGSGLLLAYVRWFHLDIRERALAKQARLANAKKER